MTRLRDVFFANIDERTLLSIPEIAYIFGVAIEDYFNPQQFAGTAAAPATFSLLMSITIIWNFMDGICSILQGIKRLYQVQEDIFSMPWHKTIISETFWVACNLLNGLQLITITIVSCATGTLVLASISFAIAMWHDLIDLAIRLNKTNNEDKNYQQIQRDFFAKFFSCVGMTLRALSAFTPLSTILILGTVVCTMVASYYVGKHSWNILSSVLNEFSCCPGFFFSNYSLSSSATNLPLYVPSDQYTPTLIVK